VSLDPSVVTAVLTPTPSPQTDAEGPTRLPSDDETRLLSGADTGARARPAAGRTASGPLNVGQNFGPRYHIIRCIGAGGMGAVYQAWDQELEVAVAVKVIRPDAIADPQMAAELERRFKRELLLARQVTHRNVVRIHDIGEIDGVKYITMPYVHGSDLATILKRENRLPVDRALLLARQIVAGLVAAHEAGVVHRDLKPANIMVDAEDYALIMDFGIARSTSSATGFAMTVAGAVIGTVEYMAPEQARGEAVDQRADVYAFGLILRDMLLGGRHAGNTTGVAELMSRMQHAPAGLRTVDPAIPDAVDALVTRCVQPNPADRYQTSAALLKDLERVASGGETTAPGRAWYRRIRPVHAFGAAVLALVLGAGAYLVVSRSGPAAAPGSAATRPAVSLAVLPFRNATGDPALNSLGTSLSEVLATDLGEAQSVRMIPPQRLQEVLGDLRIDPNANFSPADLKRIASFASAGSILWGQYVKFGDEIRIDAQLQDLEQGRSTPLKASAANQAAILDAVAQLAAGVQQELAHGSDEVLKQLQATAWRPTTRSVAALGLYNDGLQLSRQDNHQMALARFEAAIQEDPNFALAHSALAQTYANLGYDAQAMQFSRRALTMSESMPPGQERYFIAAAHYGIANEPDQAIATYDQLLKVAPNNARVHFELAALYEQTGGLDKAQEHYARAVELDPKHIAGLTAVGRVHIKRGNPQASLQPLNSALSLAIELDNNDARATALQAMGVAYKRMGRPADALKHYQQSLEIKRELGQKRGMASSLSEIAQIEETMGRPQDAVKSYNEALALQREIRDQAGTSMTLINLGALLNETFGRPDDALPLLREALGILRDGGNRGAEALALNNIGSAYLAKGQYSDAQTYFERALEFRERTKVPREIADTLHNLGETLHRMGRFDQALARYLRALGLRRADGDGRSEAIESYSIGTVFDYQGRYGAAVQSKADALKVFRTLKQRDFWLAEILSGHGASLALSGRFDESGKSLDEALTLARELQNNGLIAQILRVQSDRLRYRGDPAGAAKLADQAAQAASRASDKALQLWSEAQVARTAAGIQPTRALAATLAGVSRQADSSGSIYLSVLSSLESAETLLRLGDHRGARQEINRTLPRAEALGLRELLARSEYVLATTMRLANDPQSRVHYASALRILDEMKREDGSGQLLERADLEAVHAECLRWSRAS
jgi:tetratricopeptide (TPR) repeat protein/tRNA A-37 threonylcarbamoyl transferase component Bud32